MVRKGNNAQCLVILLGQYMLNPATCGLLSWRLWTWLPPTPPRPTPPQNPQPQNPPLETMHFLIGTSQSKVCLFLTPFLQVVDLAGGPAGRAPNVGRVQISTMCVHEDLVAAGGFHGELVVKNLSK